MSEQENIAKLIGALDDLWSEGEHDEAIAGAMRLTEAYPRSAAAFEKLALLRVHYAALNPTQDQLGPALDALNKALEIDPGSISAREVRANLYFLLAHQLNDAAFFQRSLKEFLELERLGATEALERVAGWRLEAARSAFMAARNAQADSGDYALAAELYRRADQETLETMDWFFRGLSLREVAQKGDGTAGYRAAAQSFLRALEVGGLEVEGRYFAADSLLSLENLSMEEMAQAERLVAELSALPQQDFLMDTLRQRLELRKKLMEGNG
ncbi:hypothetical protein IT570_10155 [Candidatus Sumerlaeota bacterium]|nr:hypothetical protein [Candidatus Sumerlaeota bacterium]